MTDRLNNKAHFDWSLRTGNDVVGLRHWESVIFPPGRILFQPCQGDSDQSVQIFPAGPNQHSSAQPTFHQPAQLASDHLALPLGSAHLAQPSWPGELGFANSTSTYSIPLTWQIRIGSLSSFHLRQLSFARPTWLGLPDLQMDFATWPIKFGPFLSDPHNRTSSMGSRLAQPNSPGLS